MVGSHRKIVHDTEILRERVDRAVGVCKHVIMYSNTKTWIEKEE